MEKARVAVLIPCYNEEVTIGKVVDDFKRSLPEAEIYVYDNNSTDHTAEIAAEHGAIVRQEPRQGKGNVVRAMFTDIDADAYIMVDGDDTYPAEAAPEMVQHIVEGYDMVIGDRLSTTYFEENKRPFHNFGNQLVRGLINMFFKSHVHDIMTGYRAMSFSFVKSYPIISQGFEIETEMTIHSLDKNLRLYEMPIQYRDRPAGSESKLNTVGDGVKVVATIMQLIKEYRPVPFFSIIGAVLMLLGIGFSVPVFMEFWATHLVARIPTLVCAGFAIIAGLGCVGIGVILEVLAKKDRKDFIQYVNEIEYLRRHSAQSR